MEENCPKNPRCNSGYNIIMKTAPPQFKKIGIITKHKIKENAPYLKRLVAELKKFSKEILLDEHSAPIMHAKTVYDKTQIMRRADMVVVLGGDGTLLKTARHAGAKKVLVAGVNIGHLGFLTEFTTQKILTALPKIAAGKFCTDERILLRVTVYRNSKKYFTTLALNDAV